MSIRARTHLLVLVGLAVVLNIGLLLVGLNI